MNDEQLEKLAREMAAYACDNADPDNDPELVAKFLSNLESVRDERIAAVWPDRGVWMKELDDEQSRYLPGETMTAPNLWRAAYFRFRANVKVAVVPEVSDAEIEAMAEKLANESSSDVADGDEQAHFKNGVEFGVKLGFRHAMKLVKGER